MLNAYFRIYLNAEQSLVKSSFECPVCYEVSFSDCPTEGGRSVFSETVFLRRHRLHSPLTWAMVGREKCNGEFVFTLDVADNGLFAIKLDFYHLNDKVQFFKITQTYGWTIYEEDLCTRVLTPSSQQFIFINQCVTVRDEDLNQKFSGRKDMNRNIKHGVSVACVQSRPDEEYTVSLNYINNNTEADLLISEYNGRPFVQQIDVRPCSFEVIIPFVKQNYQPYFFWVNYFFAMPF